MIKSQPISMSNDPGASMSYISPRIFELCKLVPEKFEKFWLVQLSTSTKRKVSSLVKNFKLMMNDFITHANLNILPWGSYDLLIGMDWLEKQKLMLNYFNKTFTCMNDNGNIVKVKGFLGRLQLEKSMCYKWKYQ